MKLLQVKASIPLILMQIREKTIGEDGIRRLEDLLYTLVEVARTSGDEIYFPPKPTDNIVYIDQWLNLQQ